MNSHLSDEQLIGYVHHTLTDAQREAMDRHLAACLDCRARLAEHETLQRRFRHTLLADLRTIQPSPNMRFAAIAPRLKRPNRFARLWTRSGRFFPAVMNLTALTGLVIALIGLFQGISRSAVGLTPTRTDSLPAVACFLFVLPVMSNYYGSRTVPSRRIASGVLAFILWIGTAILGLYEILLIRETLFSIYARFWCSSGGQGRDYWRALALGDWALIPLGIVWLALVVGGGEYHYRRVGQRSSWKLFGWTITVEALILVLVLFV